MYSVPLLPEEAHRRGSSKGMGLDSGEWHDSWLLTFLLLLDDQCGSVSTCWCCYYGMSLRAEGKRVLQQAG